MNNYYLIITSKESYQIDIKNKFSIIGFPERNRNSVKKFKPGDKIIFYITKVSKFGTVAEVTSDFFYSETPIWNENFDEWPYRVKAKPLVTVNKDEQMLYIKDIWDELEFIKNKEKWGSQVMGSFRKLSENDFNVLYKKLREVN